MLSSCGKGESDEKTCSPDKNIMELVSKKYSDAQLRTISQLEATMSELNKQYPIECLRKIGTAYRVSYLGNDGVAIIYFDSSEKKTLGSVCRLHLTKADFDELTIGQSLERVQELDPQGEYLFLYSGRNDAPKISTHYTIDGYLITVEYDEENAILGVTTSLI